MSLYLSRANVSWFVLFWGMQCAAVLLFTWAELGSRFKLGAFVVASILAFTSMHVLNQLYKSIPVNIAYGIGIGVAFLLAQGALALVFRTGMTAVQWIGVAVIAGGILMVALGKR